MRIVLFDKKKIFTEITIVLMFQWKYIRESWRDYVHHANEYLEFNLEQAILISEAKSKRNLLYHFMFLYL